MKYFPDIDVFCSHLSITPDSLNANNKIAVHPAIIRFLITQCLKHMDFNLDTYLLQNPDISSALKNRELKDAFDHFVNYGYFEGRKVPTEKFDEKWYLSKYPDVADALDKKLLASAQEHYELCSKEEMRAPNKDINEEMRLWGNLLEIVYADENFS